MAKERTLISLRSVGPATIRDLAELGITSVAELAEREAQELYDGLCARTGQQHDICVLDVFSCAVAQARDPNLPQEQQDWFWWSARRKCATSR
ncbi:helix-hairpin-helix domain-containing protein [Desulfovibrio mangrovi]|uniref:helix-hairpin-helix domain-containing protein n=1 Tax=Desulfovibrio mangrovi TaxID=2976983 RepID=UPI0022455E17|nr:helix-hairpin-helix domain-containing protein [Desulfovibrio mangrovi]UZP69064.1 helix-hairpin-helix domain-containing protein [Desulfovibrio mangrovi]